MRSSYLGVFSVALFWHFTSGIFGEYPWQVGLVCLVLAAAFFLLGAFQLRRSTSDIDGLMVFGQSPTAKGLLAGTACIWLVTFSYPFNVPGWLLLGVFLFSFLHRRLPQFSIASWLFAAVAGTQTAIWFLGRSLFSKWHALPGMEYPVSWMLRMMGEDASCLNGVLTVQSQHGNVTCIPTVEGLQSLFFVAVFALSLIHI